LPCGSYIARFWLPGHKPPFAKNKSQSSKPCYGTPSPTEVTPTWTRIGPLGRRLIVVVSVGLVAVASLFAWYARPPAMTLFWQPLLKSSDPVLFCIPDQGRSSTIKQRDADDPPHDTTLSDQGLLTIAMEDVQPVINIAGLLRAGGKAYQVQGESQTSLTDLRRGPSVFIGTFDNGWTLRLTSALRFHFANDPRMTRCWIEDRANPSNREWLVDRPQQQQAGTYRDYAIVARFVHPDLGQYVVIVAGLGRGGTEAGGEFLTNRQRMGELTHQLPGGWEHRNIEIVLETQVVEWHSGSPQIEAVHTW
jgi:hypothetical protein